MTKKKPLFYYKFVSFDRKDILENGLIRFTSAKDFNDPFELQLTITPYSLKFIEYINDLSDDEIKNINFNDNDYLYSQERFDLLSKKRNLLNKKINQIGILSLSSNSNINQFLTVTIPEKDDPRTNLIMWSHYADSHKGFVIEFKENFIEGIDIQKVEYNDERDIITYEEIDNNNFKKLFFKKSTEWAYEQEYRALLNLNEADKITKDKETDDIHLFKFKKSKINSITFGCNMSKKHKKEIMDLIKKDNDYQGVRFNHSYLNDEGFYLNFYDDNGRWTNRPEHNGQLLTMHTIPTQKKL